MIMRMLICLLLLGGFVLPAVAQQPAPQNTQQPAPPTAEQRTAERRAAVAAAFQLGTRGPAEVKLRDIATLQVPDAVVYVPTEPAARVMRALGNSAGDTLVGLVLAERAPWVVVIRYVGEGYVKDDDAKDWNADDLLKNLQQGTEEGNADRIARGFTPIEISGWMQPPAYDTATHRLVWAAIIRDKGSTDSDPGVNYNTRALGREGYFSVNLLTTQARLEQDKPVALALLNNLGFNSGKRYEDFNATTDHVAEYGLAALLGIVAVKKLGLLALAGVFVLKFAKIGAIAVAGVGYAVSKIFRRKPKPGV